MRYADCIVQLSIIRGFYYRYVVVSVSDAQNISKSQWQGQCVIALSEVVPHEPVKDSYELGTPVSHIVN